MVEFKKQEKRIDTFNYIYLYVLVYLLLTPFFTYQIRVSFMKSNPHKEVTSYVYKNKVIYSDKKEYVIGMTSKYLFIYSEVFKTTYSINRDSIETIRSGYPLSKSEY
jgi:hypothetical protein